MTSTAPAETGLMAAIFRTWLGIAGLVVAVSSTVAMVFFLLLDVASGEGSAYHGVMAYMVLPGGLTFGVALLIAGILLHRRRLARGGAAAAPRVEVDFSRPATMRAALILLCVGVLLLLGLAVMSYRGYHFTESTTFCGKACHEVMSPEHTAYQGSPHARISCAECHIGSGASWYAKSKLSGLYQVYAVLTGKFERPIPTPVKNLRPAQDTCEECHWPSKFTGNLDRNLPRRLADKDNTPVPVRLLLKVGGGDAKFGAIGGIHWHVGTENAVEYVASDERRQVIPWVRVTDRQGKVTEYRSSAEAGPQAGAIRHMDCIDCHNRPAHVFHHPSDALDLAMATGELDPAVPEIKKRALALIGGTYATVDEAMAKIAAGLAEAYKGDPRLPRIVEGVQSVYRHNYFPEMKTNWKTHTNNVGHKYWPGCFRCHDGNHKTADGKQTITADCNACHAILSQGSGEGAKTLSLDGLTFDHPGGDTGGTLCHECHGE